MNEHIVGILDMEKGVHILSIKSISCPLILILCIIFLASLTGCGGLHNAAIYGDLTAVRKLVESGVDVNEGGGFPHYMNSLHYAAKSGHNDVVRYLLDNGADINAGAQLGATPLYFAACFGHIGTVQLLLSRGADPGIPGRQGSPLRVAEKYGYTSIVRVLEQAENKWYPIADKSVSVPSIASVGAKPEKTTSAEKNAFSQYWAVIIGISKYKHSGPNGLNNLIFADDDAKVFARVLSDLGWSDSHVKLLVNEEATQRNILIALESWLTKAGPKDQIVLFWAGHGFPDPEDPEKVYFACYDTDITIPATGYRMDRVRSILEERKSKNVVVLADTCHAGKLITRGDRGLSIVPNIEKMSREQKVPKGWIFMVGADTDRQAIEHTSWTNGAFTHSLIKGLSGKADGFQSAGAKDGVVTMGELKDYMNTAMPNETHKVLGVAKRPVITTSTGDPDIWNLTLQAK